MDGAFSPFTLNTQGVQYAVAKAMKKDPLVTSDAVDFIINVGDSFYQNHDNEEMWEKSWVDVYDNADQYIMAKRNRKSRHKSHVHWRKG